MKEIVWISYDLGVKGDYEGLYAWLDDNGAKECGNSIAVLQYNFEKDLIGDLQEDLTKNINFTRHDRIYLIWQEAGKIKGRFIVGKRKASPWSGYGAQEPQIDEAV